MIKVQESYRKSFRKYGIDAKALQWISKRAQKIRLRELVKDIDFEGKSVLDVGCGFGDLIQYIQKKAKNYSYTGIDLVSEFIEIARKRYPKGEFIVRDYFRNSMKGAFDVVLTSGTLNAKIENTIEFRKKAIKVMWKHAKEAVVFNMAGGYPQPKTKKSYKVYYADSLEILKFCLTLTSKIIFRHHYHRKDFMIVMFK